MKQTQTRPERLLLICDYAPELLGGIMRTLKTVGIADCTLLRKRRRSMFSNSETRVFNLPLQVYGEESQAVSSILSSVVYLVMAIISGIFIVIHRKCDTIIAVFAFPQGMVAALIGLVTRRKVDILTDGGDVDIILNRAILRPLLLFSLRHAEHVGALNSSKSKRLFSFGIKNEVCATIGVDTIRFSYTPFKNKERDCILYVGRLSGEKRPQVLLRACKRVREVGVPFRLILVGDGPLKEELYKMVNQMGLEGAVIIQGHVPHAAVDEFYAKCGIFVLPSAREGVSVALLEAMSSGCACIVSDIPDNRELIIDSRTGLVFRADDDNDLANKIVWTLRQQSSTIDGMTRKARMSIERNYSLEAVGSAVESLL